MQSAEPVLVTLGKALLIHPVFEISTGCRICHIMPYKIIARISASAAKGNIVPLISVGSGRLPKDRDLGPRSERGHLVIGSARA